MAIHDRNLQPGTRLAARYKGDTFFAEVIESDEAILFQLHDRSFSSLSAAGSAITGGTRVNGWVFWSVADQLKPRKNSPPREGKLKPKVVRLIRRVPNQRGVDDGSSRWWCSSCMKSFIEQDAEPENCPEGHPREAANDVPST